MLEINNIKCDEILKKDNSVLIDVRDKIEYQDFNIGGVNIPAHEISKHYHELEKFDNIVVVCSNGMRSFIIARVLESKLKNPTIYHLTEGIF